MMSRLSQCGLMLCMLASCCHGESRDLAVGDFQELNDLLEGAVIKLPDARVETNSITVDMTNVRCTNFQVDDIAVNAKQSSDVAGDTRLQLDIYGLDMVCYLDYKYSFIFTRYGQADLYSNDNQASVSMIFQSPNYKDGNYNPTQSYVEQCSPQVNVANIDFRGDIAAIVLSVVEGLLRNEVEAEAEKRICDELSTLSQTLVTDTLKGVDGTLHDYISAPTPDPLGSEKVLSVPDNVTILDFQDKKTNTWKKWLDQMLTDAVAFLTKQVDDDVFGSDMNINVLIRANFLDEDRAFILDVDELLNENKMLSAGVVNKLILYQSHDRFLQPTILLDSVKIYGLDTLTKFEPLVDIGNYTLQNELSFRYLTVELGITMDIKPSTQPDSIFENPNVNGGIVERVKIMFGVEDLKAVASVLLAVDEERLGLVSLGSLLDTDQILGCFLSTLFRMQVSTLSVEVSDIQPPTLEGFVSPGIDRVVSSSVEAAFLMYKAAILEAAPGFFQMTVTDFLNKKFLDTFPEDIAAGDQCSRPNISVSESGFIDFRDLLLTPEEAQAAGGLGTQPYGDVVYTIVSELKEQFLGNDTDGSPKVNSLIRDFFGQSSNVTNAVIFTDDVLNTTVSLGMGGFQANLDFRIFDAHVENFDTIGSPLQLLEPVVGEANLLNNSVCIGVDSKPVRLSAKLLIALSDGGEFDSL